VGGAATKIRTGSFRGDDGTRLAWYETGDPDGTPLVLCAGLGGGFAVWRPLLARLGRRFRVLTWDYRGLYASAAPRRRDALAMRHQVADLVALLRHARADAPLLMGWSMGVQLALELHREHPKLARGFVGLFGTAGRPFGSAFDAAWPALVAPTVLAGLRAAGTRFRGVGPALARAPGVARAFVGASRAFGLMAPRIDLAAFTEVAEAWTRLDLEVYARHFEALDAHDAWDLLPDIRTPSLLIAGGRDRLTPPHLSERIADGIPGADFALIEEATHFGLIEEPEAIAARILAFAHERLGV
jgi:aminoacrylate hydrolase